MCLALRTPNDDQKKVSQQNGDENDFRHINWTKNLDRITLNCFLWTQPSLQRMILISDAFFISQVPLIGRTALLNHQRRLDVVHVLCKRHFLRPSSNADNPNRIDELSSSLGEQAFSTNSRGSGSSSGLASLSQCSIGGDHCGSGAI